MPRRAEEPLWRRIHTRVRVLGKVGGHAEGSARIGNPPPGWEADNGVTASERSSLPSRGTFRVPSGTLLPALPAAPGRTFSPRVSLIAPLLAPLAPYRVTIVVALGLVSGALLQWAPAEPSPYRWVAFGVSYLVGGGPIVRNTWRSLREWRLSIDFLMGAAALGAAVVGEPFEGAVLIFLFSLSNDLEARALGKTRRAVESLVELRPDRATLLGAHGEEVGRVPVDSLSPGDRIRVRPGERIAVDGRVVDGSGEVDQSAITGESLPARKAPGSEVFAATILSGGSLTVEMSRAPHETLLARIINLVEEARENRAPAQRFIDRFAHPYTMAVVAVALLYAVAPPLLMDADWSDAFYRSMTLLVVASPCALIISTPATILSGIGNGARSGILFKGGVVLDQAGAVDTLAFDKTGTLTEGRPRLLDRVTADAVFPGAQDPERELLRLAASLERDAEHHLGRALIAAAEEEGLELAAPHEFQAVPGEGVSGSVEGRRLWVGNAAMAERWGLRPPPLLRGWAADSASSGRSVVYVGTETGVVGALAFGDRLKPDAAATIRHLKYEGARWITILSGDHPEAVRAVAAELGVDEVRAGLLPHEKVEAVRELEARSRGVAMVGDGVNDAPAMAASSMGIAMGAAGTDVAIETADVVLMGEEVARVDYVFHLGRRSRRLVQQNVGFSVGWMAFLVAIAGTVGMPLWLAVVAHEGSTLLVALNGLRLLGSKPHPPRVPADRNARRKRMWP